MGRQGKLGRLKNQIEKRRGEMIASGMSKGLSHPETIRLSQELDKLINKSILGGK